MGRKRKTNEPKARSPLKTRKRTQHAASIALTSSPRRGTKCPKPLLAKKAKKARRRCTLDAPSPNLQTRSRRIASGVTCANNTVEVERINRLVDQFKNSKTKPCSVFGVDRYVRYRDFFFCQECHSADTKEQLFPNQTTNRTGDRSLYKCTANHRNCIYPTDRQKIVIIKTDLRAARLDAKKKIQERILKKGPSPSLSSTDSPLNKNSSRRLNFITPSSRQNLKNKISPSKKSSKNGPACKGFAVSNSSLLHLEKDEDLTTNTDTTVADSTMETMSPSTSHTNESIEVDDNSTLAPPKSPTFPSPGAEDPEDIADEPMDEDAPLPPLITGNSSPTSEPTSHCDELTTSLVLSKLQEQYLQLQRSSRILKEQLEESRANAKRHANQALHWKNQANVQRAQGSDKLPTSVGKKANGQIILNFIRTLIETKTSRLANDNLASQAFFMDLARMLLDPSLHGGQSLQCSYEVFRRYVREHVYTPFNILKQMDMMGGGLNYNNLEILREIETGGRPWQRTLLPSRGVLQDMAKEIEEFGEHFAPFKMFRNQKTGSEGFAFRAADVMVGIMMAGNVLDEEAHMRSIHMSQSLDGALFTRNLGHTLGGLKFNDQGSSMRHSRNGVFPLLCVCSRESKGIVRGIFHRMIREVEEAAETVLPMSLGIEMIVITTNCDMSCEWKLAGRGGAARQVTYPCTKCAVQSGSLHLQSQPTNICTWCRQLGHTGRDGWICRHHKICTKEVVAQLEDDVDKLEAMLPEKTEAIEELWDNSELEHKVDPRHDATPLDKGSNRSIHYDISVADANDRRVYGEWVTTDLALRGMDVSGNLQERQARLKTAHVSEWMYFRACQNLAQFNNSQIDAAMVLVMDCVPCILHMENRMGLLFLSMVLKNGLGHAKHRKGLPWMSKTEKKTETTRIAAFLSKVNATMNTAILGTQEQPRQWVMPYDNKTKSVAIICMDNVRVRKVVQSFDKLVDICVYKVEDKTSWKTCIGHYREGFSVLLRKEDLDDDTIWSFQRNIDFFFAEWIEIHGENGVTNYCHMLGSGHIMEFLLYYRNLSQHSQQGWEGKLFYRDVMDELMQR